ncbi:MAG: hypothetical protein LBR60_03290 [Fibrobacter sp.]|jgi:hypothetical protein|nr:hypothetical protein [Fibrobacter sp.]
MSKVFQFGLLMVVLLFGVVMISCNEGPSDGVVIDVGESSSSSEMVNSSSSVPNSSSSVVESSSSGTANSSSSVAVGSLVGAWVLDVNGTVMTLKNDGGYYLTSADDAPLFKGTYSVAENENAITVTLTHMHGTIMFGVGGFEGTPIDPAVLPNDWLTPAELAVEIPKRLLQFPQITPEMVANISEESLTERFTPNTYTYSLNGNKLTMGGSTYTRK